MILNSDEYDKVSGEIYKITNIVTKKSYIGQTRSHRKNHGKYRPFGYLGRFNSHISNANSSKQPHCCYLTSSMRKYGKENFICERILSCRIDELDKYETQYILELGTKYPNGYNLTNGGQGKGYQKGDKIIYHEPNPISPTREKKSLKRSDETKMLMSKSLKETKKDENHRKKMSLLTQTQHSKQKFDRFKNVTIDESQIDQYLHIRHNHTLNYQYVVVIIKKAKTSFVGKSENIEEIKERARTFIKELIVWQHNQIDGELL